MIICHETFVQGLIPYSDAEVCFTASNLIKSLELKKGIKISFTNNYAF